MFWVIVGDSVRYELRAIASPWAAALSEDHDDIGNDPAEAGLD
jgi:hypothetical protein